MDNLNEAQKAYKAKYDATLEQQVKAKLEAGRYTLEEAAKFVADNSKASAESILSKLKESAKTGGLIVYEPGSDEPYKPEASRHAPDNVVRGWYEEAFWNDLNEWLKKNAPRIFKAYQFPDPDAPAAKGKAGAVTTPAPAAKAGTNKKKWGDAELRALWEESIMPGVTTISLATKHGVTRQRIASLLKTAKGKFSTTRTHSGVKNSYGQLIK